MLELKRYFEALSKFALPHDRERHLIQAEEYRSHLVNERADFQKTVAEGPEFDQFDDLRKVQRAERAAAHKAERTQNVRRANDLQQSLDAAQTLSELGTLALQELMKQAGVQEKWTIPLKKRLRWVDGVDWTLDSAASLAGATRERLRQVVGQLDGLRVEIVVTPRILFRVLELAEKVADLDELFQHIKEEGFSHTEDQWTKESLLELFHVIAKPREQEALSTAYRKLSPFPRSAKRDALIRSLRSKDFGVFSLDEVSTATEIPIEDVLKAVRPLYKYVFSSGGLGIAIAKAPGTFVSIVGKQLIANPDASSEALFEGIQRYEKYRRLPQDLSFKNFSELVRLLFGEPISLENLPPELREGISLSEFEAAVLHKFLESGRSQLHRDELESVAPEVGISSISAGVYLSHSPIVRSSSIRRGYYRIV